MARSLVVHSPEELKLLVDRLGSADRPLKQIGIYLVNQAQDAFVRQGLGEIEWPERYPNQSEPFVNVAGLVSDFNSGKSEPKANRFDRRPAAMESGTLAGSITFTVFGDHVSVGTNVPYAPLHQYGGKSRQPVTPEAKARLGKWFEKRGRKAKKERAKARTETTNPLARDVAKPDPLVEKLRFLLTTDELETEVVQRPFLGITDEVEREIRDVVEAWAVGEEV
jgi:phage gpG-like protein